MCVLDFLGCVHLLYLNQVEWKYLILFDLAHNLR